MLHHHADFRSGPGSSGSETAIAKHDIFFITFYKTIDQIDQLRYHWKQIERLNEGHPIYFQSFEWCSNWLKTNFGDDERNGTRQPLITVVSNAFGKPILIAPMMVTELPIGIRVLSMVSYPLSQYSEILADFSRLPNGNLEGFLKRIVVESKADVLLFKNTPTNSLLSKMLSRVGVREAGHQGALYLDLSGFDDWDAYTASLPQRTRKERRRRRNRLERQGVIEHLVHQGNSPAFAEQVEQAIFMKHEWLRQTGRHSAPLADDRTRDFLMKLPWNDHNEGAVAHELRVDGKAAAIEIGMVQAGRYYSFLGAFDWELRHLSPGKVQIEAAQRWCKENGIEIFDFLGDYAEYKRNWTNARLELENISVPITLKGLIYSHAWLVGLRPALKSVQGKISARNRRALHRLAKLAVRGLKVATHPSGQGKAG